MAVKLYVGDAGGIARQVKKLYVGDANGVAREVKTLYVGDGGEVARKVFEASGSAPAGRLPAGYTEVEYAQNGTGSTPSLLPYIQMPAKTVATKFAITFSSEQSSPANDSIVRGLYGYHTYSSSFYYYGIGLYQGKVCQLSGTAKNSLIAYSANTIYEIVFDSAAKTMTANGVITSKSPGTAWRSNKNRLYGQDGDEGGGFRAKQTKVYSLKMWDADGNLVLEFVPCIDPSGAIGMYDVVGSVFYGNSNTSTHSANKFIAGPAVS